MLALAAVVDLPHQRRPAVQILGDLGEAVLVGVHAGDDLVADLPHRRVVEGQQPRADFFLAAGAVVHARADERDVAADVFLQQPLRVEQVELIVLFEDAEAGWLAERAEVDGRRVHRRRDVEKAQIEDTVRQRHLPHVAHQRDVGVVDGNRQFSLVLDGRRDDVVLSGLDGPHCRRCAAGGQQSQRGNAQKRAGRAAPELKRKIASSLLRRRRMWRLMGRTEEGELRGTVRLTSTITELAARWRRRRSCGSCRPPSTVMRAVWGLSTAMATTRWRAGRAKRENPSGVRRKTCPSAVPNQQGPPAAQPAAVK